MPLLLKGLFTLTSKDKYVTITTSFECNGQSEEKEMTLSVCKSKNQESVEKDDGDNPRWFTRDGHTISINSISCQSARTTLVHALTGVAYCHC